MTPDDRATLTEEQIEDIAERAAEKAMEKLTSHIFEEVGRSVINKLMWMIGALTVGLFLWAKQKGLI